MSDGPLLPVRGLVSGYGPTCVLQGVDFDVPRGSVVTLIGRNGVGKTTTLWSILGNVPSSGRTITSDGAGIATLSSEKTAREGIVFVPEECRVFPGLTVPENIEIGRIGGRRNTEKPTVDAITDEFENLARHRSSRGTNLSDGEQQMLVIAHALVSASDLLLLDELTKGLALVVIKQAQRKIEELNDDGVVIDEALDRYFGVSIVD